jgi:hypothetical protein
MFDDLVRHDPNDGAKYASDNEAARRITLGPTWPASPAARTPASPRYAMPPHDGTAEIRRLVAEAKDVTLEPPRPLMRELPPRRRVAGAGDFAALPPLGPGHDHVDPVLGSGAEPPALARVEDPSLGMIKGTPPNSKPLARSVKISRCEEPRAGASRGANGKNLI